MSSATIKLFLVHGDAKRLRTAELSNWTGKAVAGPRTEFDSILARDEAVNPGVYFLTGVDPESERAILDVLAHTDATVIVVGHRSAINDIADETLSVGVGV
mgnify:CR=1 FL=1